MNITVLSRSEAEAHSFHSGDWVISINERPEDMARLNAPQAYLQLCFDDVDTGKPNAMTEFDAEGVIKFALQAKERGKRLWVHCRAGISRSAAVAQALEDLDIAQWSNKGEKAYIVGAGYQSRFHPNAHVLALIKRLAWERQPAPPAEVSHE